MTIESTAVPRENLTLVEHGLFPIRIHANLTPPVLIEHALRRSEGILTDHGAFTAVTAPHTGRSAKDKFLVDEPGVSDRIIAPNPHPPSVTAAMTAARKATCRSGCCSVCLMMMSPSTPMVRMAAMIWSARK